MNIIPHFLQNKTKKMYKVCFDMMKKHMCVL